MFALIHGLPIVEVASILTLPLLLWSKPETVAEALDPVARGQRTSTQPCSAAWAHAGIEPMVLL